MLEGYLFGEGFFLSFASTVLLLFLPGMLRRKKASVAIWKKYFQKLIDNEKYEEAAIVNELIKGKKSKETIATPKGYKVASNSKVRLTGKGLKVKKNIKIIKIKT